MTAIIGMGNMGTRYKAILDSFNVKNICFDIDDSINWVFDRAIIATPTDTHYEIVKNVIKHGVKKILVEKPVSKNIKELYKLRTLASEYKCDLRMVSNWRFTTIFPLEPNKHKIFYNCYNTGKDGLEFDCIQLIYLSKEFPVLSTTSPFFICSIDGMNVTLTDIEKSYMLMLAQWLQDSDIIWTINDAIKATEKIIKEKNNVDIHSSTQY